MRNHSRHSRHLRHSPSLAPQHRHAHSSGRVPGVRGHPRGASPAQVRSAPRRYTRLEKKVIRTRQSARGRSEARNVPVTDWPYFSPAGPETGMSCRPSTRFDSIMTPMIMEEVSPDSNCRACISKVGVSDLLPPPLERLWNKNENVRCPPRPRSAGYAAFGCSRGCSQSVVR